MNEIERAYYVSEIYLPDKAKKKQETERALQETSKAQAEIESQRRLFRHEWKIAIFNTVAGGIAGFLTSLAFWLITK